MKNTPMTVTAADFGTMGGYRFVVIFSRYKGGWLLSRKRGRDGFETQGGHIEAGESPLEAARRELWEESGALKFELAPAFDYDVRTPDEYSTGQVFIAEVEILGSLPDFEMEEVRRFDGLPEKMTYPYILPVLFEKIQDFINNIKP